MKHLIKPFDTAQVVTPRNPDIGIMWGIRYREIAMLQDEQLLFQYQSIIYREWKPKQGRGRPARIPLKGDVLPPVHKKLKWQEWGSMPHGTLARSKIPAA